MPSPIGGVHDEAVEVTADEVAKNNRYVEEKDGGPIKRPVVQRYAKVVECVCHTVGKAAHDEKRDAKQQRQVLALTRKSYGGGHDEATANGQYATFQRASSESG